MQDLTTRSGSDGIQARDLGRNRPAYWCAITGNIVSNESGGDLDRSMVLVPRIPRKVAAVVVTGNVLIGRAILPIRQNPPPFNTWDGLNTLMTVLS